MIVLNDRPGQLCNRLWSYAPFVALSIRDKVPLFVPFFEDYAQDFANLNTLPRVRFVRRGAPLYLRVMLRLLTLIRTAPGFVRTILRLRVDSANWGAEAWDDATLRQRGQIVFLSGWNHPAPVADLRPYRAQLEQIFQLPKRARVSAEAALDMARQSADRLVGVHIRRGDYREFLNGKYHFANERYVQAMRDIVEQTDGRVTFLLCSNEPVDLTAFSEFDTVILPGGDALEDLHGLRLCDFIVAAPSTFSLWASFIGQVPLHFLTDADHRVDLANFSPAACLSHLANGTPYTLREEAAVVHGPWNCAL